jgi:hypothetical protein
MGIIMGKARGKTDAQLVNLLLKDAIKSKLNT